MKLAIIQTNPEFGKVKSNVEAALDQMVQLKADLYVLPELFNTGYNFAEAKEVQVLAEKTEGTTFQAIYKFCREWNCFAAYGFAEQAESLFNSSALVGPNGLVGLYRKVHLFDRENLFFAPGDLEFPVFDLPFGKVGMMICFDWFYPESARTLALKGAELILHPANLVLPHCPDAMVTRCLENRVFAATANRVGVEERRWLKLTYIGMSEIVSPKGEILTRLSGDKAESAVVEIDLSLARNKKLNQFNDLLAGRREEAYKT
jgi:predicted amidohydrolase